MGILNVLAVVLLAFVAPPPASAGGKDAKNGEGKKEEPKKSEITLKDGKHNRVVDLKKPDAKFQGKPAIVLTIRLEKGKSYQFDLIDNSDDGDPWLVLEDAKGKVLAQDDDGGGELNSRLVFRCEEAGVYRVVCTVFEDDEDAALFTLAVEERK